MLRRVAIIVAQQPTQALLTPYLIAVGPHAWLGCHALVGEALMIPFMMITGEIGLLGATEQKRTLSRPVCWTLRSVEIDHHHLATLQLREAVEAPSQHFDLFANAGLHGGLVGGWRCVYLTR